MSIDLKAICEAWEAAQTTVGDDYGVTEADAMKLARAVEAHTLRWAAEYVKTDSASRRDGYPQIAFELNRRADAIERGDEKDYADRDAERARAEREL